MISQLLKKSPNLHRFDHWELIGIGALLLAGAAGCTATRSQTAAANPQSETRIAIVHESGAPSDGQPAPADEYPDFRGRTQSSQGLRGPGFPPLDSATPADELNEPSQFPGVDEQNDGGPAALRRPRGQQKPLLAGAARPSRSRVAFPVSERLSANAAGTSSAGLTRTAARPADDSTHEASRTPIDPAPRTFSKLPEWSSRVQASREQDWQPASQVLASAASSAGGPGNEPVRVSDPPRLNTIPAEEAATELLEAPSEAFGISKMRICRQVRGFDDLVEFSSENLRQGQPILVYAALEEFLSILTGDGYRTQTISSLEIQTLTGEVVLRIPLGQALDFAPSPRQEFYLTHRVIVPEQLAPGAYLFNLRVDDMQSRESARAQVQVTIKAGRNLLDETDGTSISATRHDSILR